MSYIDYLLKAPELTDLDLKRIEAIRQEAYDQYRSLPIEQVWDMAHFHICFRDDAPTEIMERHTIFTSVAQEIVRLSEWRNNRPEPTLPLPKDARWVWGGTDLDTYNEVQARYPGILGYFKASQSAPSTNLWDWVSRYNQWAAVERDLMRLQIRGEEVTDWREYEDRIRTHLERVHLGVAEGDFDGPLENQ